MNAGNDDTKEREITIRFVADNKEQKFRMPLRHKFEEYKYMLEDLFKFETFARRLHFRFNHRPVECLEDIKPNEINGPIVIEMQTE